MSTEIVMPRLSDTMERGTIAHWNKKSGDSVKKGEVLLEIETDKANMELESYSDGILARIIVQEGETAAVGTPIGLVAGDETELKDLERDSPRGGNPAKEVAKSSGRPARRPDAAKTSPVTQAEQADAPSNGDVRIKASPLARRIAQRNDVDLTVVSGTGPGGRIVREDVESYAENRPAAGQARIRSTRTEDREAPAGKRRSASGDREVPLSRMRQTVATRLSQSMTTAPHFYVTSEIDMTHAIRMRAQINDAEPDLDLSFNDLIVKASSVVLTRFPQVNASYLEGKIVQHGRVNIGIAVDIPGGLIVPVVKDIDRKGLRDIAAETKILVAGAREGRLKPDNFEGGTFTISNLGMYGIDQFTAIINPPESAILAVGAIQEKPVVFEGQIAVRSRMRVTLSCDHRVVYGAEAAAFLAELRRTLEYPVLVLL